MCGCLSHAAKWGPGPQPRPVPLLGIEPATLWFTAHTQYTELHQPGLRSCFKVAVKGIDNTGMEKVWGMRKYGVTPPPKMGTERRADSLGVTSYEKGMDVRQA